MREPYARELYAQGDLLIERVRDTFARGDTFQLYPQPCVLAEGELTGHRHAIFDRVTMFRDDALARDIPADLYVGHVNVEGRHPVEIIHQEHAPVRLSPGTWRVRRQREMDPRDIRRVAD